MQKHTPLVLVTLAFGLVACSSSSDSADALASGGIIVPDTATVDGVLQMRFPANAFERAPELTLDTANMVIIEGGDNLDFDLSGAGTPRLFADGRVLLAANGAESRLLLFNSDGSPSRVLARNGGGPGEVGAFTSTMRMSEDTLVLSDVMNRRINLVTADSGIVYSESYPTGSSAACKQPITMLPGRKSLAFSLCESPMDLVGSGFSNFTLVSLSLDQTEADTLAKMNGPETGEMNFMGVSQQMPVRFGSMPFAAVWGDNLATSADLKGYRFDQRGFDGSLLAQLVVERPRRAVTEPMVQAMVDLEMKAMEGIEGMPVEAPSGMLEQVIEAMRNQPSADSLPGFATIYSGTDGALWAVDYKAPTDSSWTAIAFNSAGSITGVLTVSTELGELASIQDNKVILKSTDDDGFVKFGVYPVLDN